jgi:hypothetical protein
MPGDVPDGLSLIEISEGGLSGREVEGVSSMNFKEKDVSSLVDSASTG